MALILGFLLGNSHPTFRTIINPFTFILLMLHDLPPLNFFSAINALYLDKWANSLMSLYLPANAFCLALFVSFALNRSKFALIIMTSYFMVLKHLRAPHRVVLTLKLHLL